MLSAVLFDWDGTLVDVQSSILHAYRHATTHVLGERFPATPDDEALALPMRPAEAFGMLAHDATQVRELLTAYDTAYTQHSLTNSALHEGAASLLAWLREQRLRIGVVTPRCANHVSLDAERFGLTDHIDHVVSGDSVSERHPHPGPILACLAAMELTPAQVLYVGDGPQDLIAASAAGVRTTAAAYGTHELQQLRAEGPDHLIYRLSELREVIEDLVAARQR